MRAIILAAGTGSRLRPLTKELPKCMIEVGEKKIIEGCVDNLLSNGIRDIVVILGYKKEILKKYLEEKYDQKINFTFVENHKYAKTNNIYSLWLAEAFFDDDIILLESDIVFDGLIIKELLNTRARNIAVVDDYNTHRNGTLILADEKNCAARFLTSEKQRVPESRCYKTVNIYKFSSDFLEKHFRPTLSRYIKNHSLSLFYEVALAYIIEQEPVKLELLHVAQSKWFEVDTATDLLKADYLFSSPEHQIEIIEKSYGGLWNYPDFIDFVYMKNAYFPSDIFIEEFRSAFKTLMGGFSSSQEILNKKGASLELMDDRYFYLFNGSSQAIKFLSAIVGTISISTPTFDEYINAVEKDHVNTHKLPIDTFETDLEQFASEALHLSSDSLIFVNPNNPTSLLIKKAVMVAFLEKYASKFRFIIVDESFIDFAGGRHSLKDQIGEFNNLIIVKSLGKSYGIAGLRLGYIYTSSKTIEDEYNKYIPIWNINSFAEYFLELFLNYRDDYSDSLVKMRKNRDDLAKGLKAIPFLNLMEPSGNFLMAEIKKEFPLTATELKDYLFINNSILLKDLTPKINRDYSDYNGNGFVRIAVLTKADNGYLCDCLKKIGKKYLYR